MDKYRIHEVGNLWAVGDDDHRFSTYDDALAYARWLETRPIPDGAPGPETLAERFRF